MKKLLTLSALAVATLFAAGVMSSGCCSDGSCGTQLEAQQAVITDVSWKLELNTLAGSGKNWEKPARDITFQIDKTGKVTGCAGVNRYFGSAALDQAKKTLKFSNSMGATKMAGKGMAYEDAYLKMLSRVDSYEVIGDKLYFKADGKILAVFAD